MEQLTGSGFEPTFKEHLEQTIDKKIDLEKAKKLLAGLEEKYREAVHLRYIADFSPKEIAEILGESENTISVRINRGIKRLKDLFNN